MKVTVTLQLEDAARVALQVLFEIKKSAALVPETATPLIAIGELPRLVKVTAFGIPDDPRFTPPHTRLLGSIRTPTTRQPVTQYTFRKRIALRKNR